MSRTWASSTDCTRSQPAVPTATAVTRTAARVMRTRTERGAWIQDLTIGVQPVPADAAHGLERASTEGLVDLAPQVAHVHLDHVVVAVEVVTPHLAQQPGLGQVIAGVADEGFEQGVLA